jgi:hypothetical protein
MDEYFNFDHNTYLPETWSVDITPPVIKPAKKKTFKCDLCFNVYKHRTSLAAHKRSAHKGKRYKCKSCNKDFCSTSARNRHHRATHENQWYPCPTCGKTFKYYSGMITHKNNLCRYDPGERVTCVNCFVVVRKNYLPKHIKLYCKKLTNKIWNCPLCFIDINYDQRDDHINSNHVGLIMLE